MDLSSRTYSSIIEQKTNGKRREASHKTSGMTTRFRSLTISTMLLHSDGCSCMYKVRVLLRQALIGLQSRCIRPLPKAGSSYHETLGRGEKRHEEKKREGSEPIIPRSPSRGGRSGGSLGNRADSGWLWCIIPSGRFAAPEPGEGPQFVLRSALVRADNHHHHILVRLAYPSKVAARPHPA